MKTIVKGRLTLSTKDTITDLKFLIDTDFATMLEDLVDSAKYDKDRYNFFYARQALKDAIQDNKSKDKAPEIRSPRIKDLKDLDAHDIDLAKVFITHLLAAINVSLSCYI